MQVPDGAGSRSIRVVLPYSDRFDLHLNAIFDCVGQVGFSYSVYPSTQMSYSQTSQSPLHSLSNSFESFPSNITSRNSLDLLSVSSYSIYHPPPFMAAPMRIPQQRATITNRLQYLSIACWDTRVSQALVSSIPLQRGAHPEISSHEDILSGISRTHLPNLLSLTLTKYQPYSQEIQLVGPNGSFSYDAYCYPAIKPSTDFPTLPLTNVQGFRLVHTNPPITFDPSSFSSLQTFVVVASDISNLSPTL